MSLEKGDKDLIAMVHYFQVDYPNNREEIIKSSMVIIGEESGLSGMAKTVGYPAAIAAKAVASGRISKRGVIQPIHPEVYD